MRVLWLARAVQHLGQIKSHIAFDNPIAAEAVGLRLVEATAPLAEYPAMGRSGRVPGTRELIVRHTSYIIVYRTKSETVEIVAVVHGARKWPESFP